MSEYRRWYVPGGTYFFTAVTFGRQPILTTDLARDLLHRAIEEVRTSLPFTLDAIVLLPDHLHTIWTLPPGDADYSTRWALLKGRFTRAYLRAGGAEGEVTASRRAHRERAVWQHRFWEHTVRDEDDLKRCLDYLHWNPVKHGLVRRVRDYAWSSFHRWVRNGEYDPEWGSDRPVADIHGAERE